MARYYHITGVEYHLRKLDKLDKAYGDRGEKLRGVVNRAAKITQSHIRREAPFKTGALKRGIIAEELTRIKNRPAAMVKANYSPGKGPIARHAHLVERGHITANGSHTTANPFFHRGTNSSAGVVRRLIKNEIVKRQEAAAR